MIGPKAMLAGSSIFCVASVYYVHYIQKKDIEDMRQGVLRDIERQKVKELARRREAQAQTPQ
jgi:hypothetical protein